MLEEVKAQLGITGDYQDDTIQGYIDEVKEFCVDAGVRTEFITPGILARGVADLWNYGSGQGKLSDYFRQRVTQLAYKR